jgi:hypothetical protein
VIRVDDARRECFAPDMELRQLSHRFLENRLRTQLVSGERQLAQLLERVPAAQPGHAEVLRKRLKNLVGWHDRTRALLPIARTFLKLTK